MNKKNGLKTQTCSKFVLADKRRDLEMTPPPHFSNSVEKKDKFTEKVHKPGCDTLAYH